MTFEPERISNCCYVKIIHADAAGHGICSECGEHCIPEEEELEILSITTIPIEKATSIKKDIPDLSWNMVFYIAVFLLLLAFIRDNLLI